MLPRLLAPDLPSTRSSRDSLHLFHSDYKPKGLISLFFVTTSSFRHWVICVPAAFLKSGSRFSGSLSGIEPWFPVTRHNHGSPLHYRQKLIGQNFVCSAFRMYMMRMKVLQLLWDSSDVLGQPGSGYASKSSDLTKDNRQLHALAAGLPQLFICVRINKWTKTDLMSHSRFHI